MHANEILNTKARYEILYEAGLEEMVVYEYKNIESGDLLLKENGCF